MDDYKSVLLEMYLILNSWSKTIAEMFINGTYILITELLLGQE